MACIPIRHKIACEVPERATALLTTTLRNLADVGISVDDLDDVRLTLYNESTPDVIINSRDHQSILSDNGGTVNEAGGLTLRLDPHDTVIVNDSLATEYRIALIEWFWTVDGVQYDGKAEIAFLVRNLQQVSEETT